MKRKKSQTKDLMSLPKTNARWYCARRRLPIWLHEEDAYEDGEDLYSIPWMCLAVDLQSGMILDSNLSTENPQADSIFHFLQKIMTSPKMPGLSPCRPSDIHFEQKDVAEALRPKLQSYGISAFHRPSPEHVNMVYSDMTRMFRADYEDSLLDGLMQIQGVTPSLAGHFFNAAAEFFTAEPWIWLSNYDVLKIEVGSKAKSRYAVVMGQAGLDYGLSVHEGWSEIEDMYLIDDPEESLPPNGRHALMYNKPPIVAIDDLLDAPKYGWKVLSEDFFPTPLMIKKRGFARPDAAMLHWYEAALKAIVALVKERLVTHPDGSHPPVAATIEVETSKGKIPVLIEYPGGDLSKLVQPTPNRHIDPEDFDEEDDQPGTLTNFDRRSLERQLLSLTSSIDGYEPIWAAEVYAAEQIIYDAWEQADEDEKIRLANKALKLSADCGDAYVVLAEGAATCQEALDYYQKGNEAARRALGEVFFQDEEAKQHFWEILETRPFLRCLEGASAMLYRMKRWKETEDTYRYLIEIDPNDHQGIRYELLHFLFDRGRYEDAALFMKENKNDLSVEWTYCRPLLDFRFKGPMKAVVRALRKAIKYNDYVPEYLLGEKRVPSQESISFTKGGEDEAVMYAGRYLNHWRRTPGAVAWLRSVYEEYSDWEV